MRNEHTEGMHEDGGVRHREDELRRAREPFGLDSPPPGEQTGLAGLADELNAPRTPAGEQGPASAASGEPEAKAAAVSPVLDDPRLIEQGPEEVCLGKGFTVKQIEDMLSQGRHVEIRPDGGLWELRYKPRDRAAAVPKPIGKPKREKDAPVPVGADRAEGLMQQGVPDRPPRPESALPVDRAEGFLQRGVPGNPDPISIHSGLRASQVAEIAFEAVQKYKDKVLDGLSTDWCYRRSEQRQQITDQVIEMMTVDGYGPFQLHARWVENMIAAGGTVEEDPRLGQTWAELNPGERRKGYIFAQVVIALLRSV